MSPPCTAISPNSLLQALAPAHPASPNRSTQRAAPQGSRRDSSYPSHSPPRVAFHDHDGPYGGDIGRGSPHSHRKDADRSIDYYTTRNEDPYSGPRDEDDYVYVDDGSPLERLKADANELQRGLEAANKELDSLEA